MFIPVRLERVDWYEALIVLYGPLNIYELVIALSFWIGIEFFVTIPVKLDGISVSIIPIFADG
ncbi:MAG: hypothetical protein FI695_03655 [SAR202 cluster bacterium]|nr:hypothetical protein [Chloroflexota bacterium]MQG51055.1 hypothetical protein [SAR202 cluster bacterium]